MGQISAVLIPYSVAKFQIDVNFLEFSESRIGFRVGSRGRGVAGKPPEVTWTLEKWDTKKTQKTNEQKKKRKLHVEFFMSEPPDKGGECVGVVRGSQRMSGGLWWVKKISSRFFCNISGPEGQRGWFRSRGEGT